MVSGEILNDNFSISGDVAIMHIIRPKSVRSSSRVSTTDPRWSMYNSSCISHIIFNFIIMANGENDRIHTNIQKSLEIEHVFVPSQYLVGAGNHICRTPNTLKTS